MNQDVLNIQEETHNDTLSIRLHWDWHNPLIAFPLAALGMIAASVIVMFLG